MRIDDFFIHSVGKGTLLCIVCVQMSNIGH